jgi:hypothetical protein
MEPPSAHHHLLHISCGRRVSAVRAPDLSEGECQRSRRRRRRPRPGPATRRKTPRVDRRGACDSLPKCDAPAAPNSVPRVRRPARDASPPGPFVGGFVSTAPSASCVCRTLSRRCCVSASTRSGDGRADTPARPPHFSEWYSFTRPDAEIIVRPRRPYELSGVVASIAYECGLSPKPRRGLARCAVGRKRQKFSRPVRNRMSTMIRMMPPIPDGAYP